MSFREVGAYTVIVVMIMNKAIARTYIAMTSITYAMKAKSLFEKQGWHSDVIRTPKDQSSGCGYSVAVRAAEHEAVGLLDRHGIPHKAAYKL